MIRNKKKTSRIISVISAVIAAVMLSATVFASGVFSDLTTDDYTVEIAEEYEEMFKYVTQIADSFKIHDISNR